MQHSPYWEADVYSACQKIPRILQNPKVHYWVYKALLPNHILSHINSVHDHFLKIRFNIILPSTTGSSKWPVSLRFPQQNSVYTSPLLINATCPIHLFLLDLITRIIFGVVYISSSSSLCNFLHSSFVSSHLGPNILHSTIFSHTFSLHSSLNVSDHDNDRYYSKLSWHIVNDYTRMPSPINQYVFNLVVSLPSRRGPSVFMNDSVREHRVLNRFFNAAKFTILTPLSLLSWSRLSFQIVGLKVSSFPKVELKYPNKISMVRKEMIEKLLQFFT